MLSNVGDVPAISAPVYLDALQRAKSSVAEGGALRYVVDHCPTRGRVIKLQTANGWSPYPLYVERPH